MNKYKLLLPIVLLFNNLLIVADDKVTEIPKDSIYLLSSQWQDQNADNHPLNYLSGKRQIVSMIYTNCLHTCPTIVSTMQAIESQLSSSELEKTGFVLFSLTPEQDTPEVLKDFAEKRELNLQRWTLLRSEPSNVRSLAMALNIKYKAVSKNEMAHSNLMTVLDDKGRILFQEIADMGQVKQLTLKLSETHR